MQKKVNISDIQDFIYKHKDLILKGKDRYPGCHELWGTCYPASYFLWELLDRQGNVFYKRINEHGNHTYIIVNDKVLDPTFDQAPGFDYFTGRKKQSMMNGNKIHIMTKKLLKLHEK